MASRSIGLGGLPDIPEGGMNIDSLVKLAHLLEMQHEQQAKYGTPGTPDQILLDKPFMASARGFQPKVMQAPVNGAAGDPSSGLLEEAQGRTLPGAQTAWVKPGTPGTMGLENLKVRSELARSGLYDEEGAQALLQGKEIGSVSVGGGKAGKVFINAAEPDPTKMISKDMQPGYIETTKDNASNMVAHRMNAIIQAKGESASGFLRLYSELKSIKPDERTEEQTTLMLATAKSLKDTLGLSGPVNVISKERAQRFSQYKTQKAGLQQILKSNLAQIGQINPKTGAKITKEDVKMNNKAAIKGFNEEYRDDNFDFVSEKNLGLQ